MKTGVALPILLLVLGCSGSSTPPPVEDNLQITILSGNGQTGAPGAALPEPLVVRVDRIEEQPSGIGPAAGVEVVWTAGTGGSASPQRSMTDAAGRASTVWTLGPVEGLRTLTAVDAGEFAPAVTFTATALAGGCPPTGGTPHSGVISAPETWGAGLHRVTGSVSVDAELTIELGARVCVAPGARIEIRNQGSLNAVGTAADPIVFTVSDTTQRWQGLRFNAISSGPSFLNDVRVLFADFGIQCDSPVHAVRIDHTLVRGSGMSALQLVASGSAVTRSTFDRTAAGTAAVTLLVASDTGQITFEGTVRNAFAAGIRAGGPSVLISRTEITGSGGPGLLVPLDPATVQVRISESNLFDNGGPGVQNLNTLSVDARFNWWGDPAGPAGPSGDGVSGDVQTSFARPDPATFEPRP